MNFMESIVEAIDRLNAHYLSALEAAGLGYAFDIIHTADQGKAAKAVADIQHPLWLDYCHRLRQQLVSQEFQDAGRAYEALNRTGQGETPAARTASLQIFKAAPEWFLDECNQFLQELDLLPPVSGYTTDGRPTYSIKDIADKLSKTPDELRYRAAVMGMPSDDPTVHTLQ
jgi:hypothetical protein